MHHHHHFLILKLVVLAIFLVAGWAIWFFDVSHDKKFFKNSSDQ